MTREEALNILYNASVYHPDYLDALNMAVEALEQEPCTDVISRQAAQDYIAKYLSQYLYDDVREAVEVIDEYIGELPSVTPAEKVGHWEYVQYDGNPNIGNWHCSECRAIVNYEPIYNWEKKPHYKFCPNCGSYNGGGDNGNE